MFRHYVADCCITNKKQTFFIYTTYSFSSKSVLVSKSRNVNTLQQRAKAFPVIKGGAAPLELGFRQNTISLKTGSIRAVSIGGDLVKFAFENIINKQLGYWYISSKTWKRVVSLRRLSVHDTKLASWEVSDGDQVLEVIRNITYTHMILRDLFIIEWKQVKGV